MKPTLACDVDYSKLKFPVIVMPKIDGVRSVNFDGTLKGRSLKVHANTYTTRYFSNEVLKGFDGEMTYGGITDEDLCRNTSSALSTIKGEPYVIWNLFDYITEETMELTYLERLTALNDRYLWLVKNCPLGAERLALVPYNVVSSMAQLEILENDYLEQGYEGIIIRSPTGKFKQGRATVREGSYMRGKRFVEVNAELVEFVEGNTNNNHKQINELGLTFRSTHKENMSPNGQVGCVVGILLEDVVHPFNRKVLFTKGTRVEVGPGNLTEKQRKEYFANRHNLVGQVFKFKTFPFGVKDKPRFPTFVCFRSESDVV